MISHMLGLIVNVRRAGQAFSGLGSSLASFQRQIGKACCRPGEASWYEQTRHEQSPDSAVFELAQTEDKLVRQTLGRAAMPKCWLRCKLLSAVSWSSSNWQSGVRLDFSEIRWEDRYGPSTELMRVIGDELRV